jgi:hypothetical protein
MEDHIVDLVLVDMEVPVVVSSVVLVVLLGVLVVLLEVLVAFLVALADTGLVAMEAMDTFKCSISEYIHETT